MRKSATLIELIFVLVILSLFLVGGFMIIGKLYKRNYIAVKHSEFEFASQQLVDEISLLLYTRIPLTLIGYNQQTGEYKYIGEITSSDNLPIIEWFSFENDAKKDLNLSGFVDMDKSDKNTKTIVCLDFNINFVENIIQNKFNTSKAIDETSAILFSGTFDRGEEDALNDYQNAFGWHGGGAEYVYEFSSKQVGEDANLTLKTKPDKIYEKFFLVDSAYAVARVEDLNLSKWKCSEIDKKNLDKDDLLLFYNYRPWKGETFCGDGGEGNVTLLAKNVSGIYLSEINSHLELKVEFFKHKGDINISVTKQKVMY